MCFSLKQADRLVFQEHNQRILFSQFTNPTNDFKFATIASTSVAEYFRRSTSEHFRRMFTFMKKYNLKSTREGAMKVLNGYVLNTFLFDCHKVLSINCIFPPIFKRVDNQDFENKVYLYLVC